MGPTLFGAVLPAASAALFSPEVAPPITVLSQIDLEFDCSHRLARHNRHAVAKVSAVGLALPFVLGIGFAGVSHAVLAPTIDAQAYALFIGTAFAISALPILGRIVLEFQMTRSVLGVIAISSAAINDVVGWLLLAGVTMIAVADFDAGSEQSLPLDVVGFVIAAIWHGLRDQRTHLARRDGTARRRQGGARRVPRARALATVSCVDAAHLDTALVSKRLVHHRTQRGKKIVLRSAAVQ